MFGNVLRFVAGGRVEQGQEANEESATGGSNSSAGNDTQGSSNAKNKVGMVMDISETSWVAGIMPVCDAPRFPYSRPEFLYLLTDDDLTVSGDQTTRPVLVPKYPMRMPMFAGYAETINSGKTERNEDQAAARVLHLTPKSSGGECSSGRRRNHLLGGSSHSDDAPKTEPTRRRTIRSSTSAGESSVESDSLLSSGSFVRRHSDEDMLAEIRTETTEQEAVNDNGYKAEAVYFAVFDGHAGTGASLMAANCLHEHIRDRLCQVLDAILELEKLDESNAHGGCRIPAGSGTAGPYSLMSKRSDGRTADGLVVGALEAAFVDMDEQIQEEKMLWRISGGCAALATLFFMGKLYVANAGDCRALLCCGRRIEPMSTDFTPETERKRLQFLAFRQPDLLSRRFSRLEYGKTLTRKDLRKKALYRDWYMDGWTQKTIREADLRPPMISENTRKSRLLNTIGVTRGFGDHHLVTVDDNIPIKPFLLPVPEVKIFDLRTLDVLTDRDVLILASDGLWDVLSNEEVANIVNATLSQYGVDDLTRYTLAAQDLLVAARGQPAFQGNSKRWCATEEGGRASGDDVTVFVIPLKFALCNSSEDDDVEILQ